jgi:hypothetical protein
MGDNGAWLTKRQPRTKTLHLCTIDIVLPSSLRHSREIDFKWKTVDMTHSRNQKSKEKEKAHIVPKKPTPLP